MEIGGFEVAYLVVGIVQIIKMLVDNLSEKGKIVIALIVGVVFLSLAEITPLLDPGTALVIVTVVRVIGNALAIPGWFGVVKTELLGR